MFEAIKELMRFMLLYFERNETHLVFLLLFGVFVFQFSCKSIRLAFHAFLLIGLRWPS